MSVSTVPASNRTKKAVLFGVIAAVVLAAAAVAGNYWWTEHNRVSQASKADCQLAQELVDSARKIPSGKAAIEEWLKTERQRRAQMKDGYLGFKISNYDYTAYSLAKGEGKPPSDKKVQDWSDSANDHCVDAKFAIIFPSLSS